MDAFEQKKFTFLTFSATRVILFCALLGAVICAAVFAPALSFSGGNAFHYETGTLAVHYLDVGQGDAIAVQFPDGRVCLIDCGTAIYYTRVKTYLTTRILKGGRREIDFLIATHAHGDHVGGFPQLLEDFWVDTVYRPHNRSNSDFDINENALGPLYPEQVYTDFVDAAYTFAREVAFIEAGTEIRGADELFGNPFSMYFHTPTVGFIRTLTARPDQEFNDISPIISLCYRDQVFVFTGDAGTKTEGEFMRDARALATDFAGLETFLKVGHHGSKNSTTAAFLEFLKPDKAVISVGARNNYGHPNADALGRLAEAGLREEDIFETRFLGNVVFATGGEADGRMFFAFDNEADLSLVYVLAAAVLFFVCFANFRVIH